ncbi:MAG TPA: acyclic terpene utilization AtuA family protein [Acidimicrobiia bacterium]|nr:acyclic terpene utilization AtuA family protein [Acidimicrobiia bacterium]
MRILCPTGHLSFTPFEQESFLAGCEQDPDVLVADAGSCDIGPRGLGANAQVSPVPWQRQDLEAMLLQARRLGIPMIIGSASDAGTDHGVDHFVSLIQDIAAEHRLASFELAAIYSEVPVEDLKRRLSRGERIAGLDGRPDATMDLLERTDRVVAVMNADPIRQALLDGADVVVAGRSSDCALFAAPLLNAGFSPAISYFTGKLMECASFCAEPYAGKETILGRVVDEEVFVTAMHPGQRCTPKSVAGHSMYERSNPFREYVAGGYVEMSNCEYTQVDEKTTKVTGARFVPSSELSVKLEGAGFVGHRRLAISGFRDPHSIEKIDEVIGWSRGKLTERFGAPGDEYRVFFHVYGRNGVMGDLGPRPDVRPHELAVVVEVVSLDETLAEEVCTLAARNMFYARVPGFKGTAGASAVMTDGILTADDAYEWTLNHTLVVDDLNELVRTRFFRIGAAQMVAS